MITPGRRDWIDYAALALAIVVGIGSSLQSYIVWTSQQQFRDAFIYSTTATQCAEFSGAATSHAHAMNELAGLSELTSTGPLSMEENNQNRAVRDAAIQMDVTWAKLALVAPDDLANRAFELQRRALERQTAVNTFSAQTLDEQLDYFRSFAGERSEFMIACREITQSGEFE